MSENNDLELQEIFAELMAVSQPKPNVLSPDRLNSSKYENVLLEECRDTDVDSV